MPGLRYPEEEAREAINRKDWALVFARAGEAIIANPGESGPYRLLAEASFLQGDTAMGEAYLRLAQQQPDDQGRGAGESAAMLDFLAAQWRVQGKQAVNDALTTMANHHPQRMEHPHQGCSTLTLLPKLRIAAGGDVLLGGEMPGWVAERGAEAPLQALAPMFRAADLALANLGCYVSTEGDFIDKEERQPHYCRCLPEMLEVLSSAGIRCIATGNQPTMDFSPHVLAQQSDILDACGFLHFGADQSSSEAALPRYVRVNEITVAFIGREIDIPCMAVGDEKPDILHVPVAQLEYTLAGSIAVARAHADLVIVSLHWGRNGADAPSSELRAAVRRLIDLGADAVLCHSAHALQGMEMHAGRPIVYGMGNLLSDRVSQGRTGESALFGLEWTEAGTCRLTVLPLTLGAGFVCRATGDVSRRILERLLTASLALDPQSSAKLAGMGLRLEGRPSPSPVRRMAKLVPSRTVSFASPPRIPVHWQRHKSNPVYSAEAAAQCFATLDNPLLLSAESMATVTGGNWQRLPADALLTGFSTRKEYIAEGSSGNVYLALDTSRRQETANAQCARRVMKAFAAGAVAAVVPKDATGLPDDVPLLRVDNVMQALERMGLYVRDKLFRGKRVLVSGTEGKTGYKHMLHHVLAPQISTHAILNSSNLTYSVLASLASIRCNDRVAVIEAAGGRLAERSHIVRPHIAVLTEVGNEHMNYHGSQQGVIEAKADIVLGLVDGGYAILNADSANYSAVRKSALARRHMPLMLFGTEAGCNGRLLERRFADGGWIVTADIEGRRVEYRLPLLGEHAPLASVGVLLSAHYLGADAADAAASLADYQPYWSEGALRRLAHRNGELLFFDNTWKSSVLGYRSALQTLVRLEPLTATGCRVGVIGEMTRLGSEAEIWHEQLAEWVDAAGFDKLILVGKRTETTFDCLKNRDIVVARFPEYDRLHSGKKELQSVINVIEAACTPGDLLFVKGELDELGDYLRAKEIATKAAPRGVQAARAAPPHEDESALASLHRIDIDDLPRYRAAIDESERITWQHYFPFQYLYDRAAKRDRILIGEDAGSLCVYRLRRSDGREEICLFLLPLPFQPAVFERCLERVRDFNRRARASVFRVDSADADTLRHRPKVRCLARPEEYVYAPAATLDLSGSKKRNVRRAIHTIQLRDDLEVLDYEARYAAECRVVLDQWAALQERKYGEIRYRGYTLGCLDHYDLFPRADLFGKVVRLNGKICSFGFAGELSRRMGNLFVVYSDLRITGLSKYMNYCLLQDMQHLPFANASHGADTPGLAFAKASLGPAFLHHPYRLYLD